MSRAVDAREAAATRDVVALNDWLSVTRLRSTSAVALFAALMWHFGIGQVHWLPVFVSCVALALFSIVALALRAGTTEPWRYFYLQTVVDILGISGAVAYAGDGRPPIVFCTIFVLVIVPSALISVRAGLVAATLSGIAQLGIQAMYTPLGEVLTSIDAMAMSFLYFLVAHQCFFYAGHLERKNRALNELANRLEGSRRSLEDLVRIGRALNSTLDAPELLARSTEAVLEQLRGSAAATFLVDVHHQTFRLAAVSAGDITDNPLSRIDFPIDAYPSIARLTERPVIALTPAELKGVPPWLGGDSLSAVYLGGFYREGILVGFVGIGYTDERPPEESELTEKLAAIAEHSAIALGNAKLLDEARQASALKSEFVSTISHELRTPLNVIIGYTEMLRDGAAGALTPRQDELFERIETSGRELFDLIEAVLQVGRLETGGVTAVFAPVSLTALMKTIEGSLGGLPRNADVDFAVEVPAGLSGTIVTDAAKVGLVVRNLVGNAFKFTPKGRVVLRVLALDDRLGLEVSDTGIGIAAENIAHIFEMFRQLKGSESRGGVGLGLHIVKQVVARLGGTLDVRSTVGEGTTFRIVLPRWEEDLASVPSRAPIALGASI